ncbi:sensor histidine kinase [Nocardioides yefusunii]|uniref:Sensor histidine kinase n=1 Tax=Nocardioides yefusunii TaxID=2500546 RepID=A0ABW1QX16_9ACTN|nr:histidine kinase [Nocardioides yefusunii]
MSARTDQLIEVVQALDPRAPADEVLLRLCRFARPALGAAGVIVVLPHDSGVKEVRAGDIAPGGRVMMRNLFESALPFLGPDDEEITHLSDEHRVLVLRAPCDPSGHVIAIWFVDEDDDDADSDRSLTHAQREVLDMVAELIGARLDQGGRASAAEARAIRRERDRISRDLHDVVVQQIFAAGLQTQRTMRALGDDAARIELSEVVDQLDRVIRDVRSVIFELEHTEGVGVRDSLHQMMVEYARVLGFMPGLRTAGDMDRLDAVVGDHMLATVRELLSNVAKHAEATSCRVYVVHEDGVLTVEVDDDGVGICEDSWREGHRSGLGNLDLRAQLLRGSLEVIPKRTRGVTVRWSVQSAKA